MYVVAVYDVASERTAKMLKLCRRYLHWTQNSVFTGQISRVNLRQLELEAREIMDLSYDSFIIIKMSQVKRVEEVVIGQQKADHDQFL